VSLTPHTPSCLQRLVLRSKEALPRCRSQADSAAVPICLNMQFCAHLKIIFKTDPSFAGFLQKPSKAWITFYLFFGLSDVLAISGANAATLTGEFDLEPRAFYCSVEIIA